MIVVNIYISSRIDAHVLSVGGSPRVLSVGGSPPAVSSALNWNSLGISSPRLSYQF